VGTLPISVFKEGLKRGQRLINEEFFIRRREFKKKVWLESHDMYYFLTKHNTRLDLARLLHKVDVSITVETWNSFLAVTLFLLQRDDVMSYNVNGLMWKFYRYARWLIRALFIKVEVPPNKRDLSILLDRF